MFMEDPVSTEEKYVDGDLIVILKYEDGSRSETNIETGDITEYYFDGTIIKIDDVGNRDINYPDGKIQKYIGEFMQETLPNGIINRYWFGRLSETVLPDGTTTSFYINKKVRTKKLSDGSETGWFLDGKKQFEKFPNGTQRAWYPNGQLEYEKICDADKRQIYCAQYNATGKRYFFRHFDKEGNDDTRVYLAKKRVAQRRVEKSAKKGKTVPKMNQLQKALKIRRALKQIDKER